MVAPWIPAAAGVPSWILAAAGGLIAGSFLNVVIHRMPRGESLLAPGSRCGACARPVRWRDNAPLVSFLLLAGRCRDCGVRIPWRYPVVEVLGAVVVATAPWREGPWAGVSWSLLLLLLVALAATDLERLVLPDRLTLPGAGAGLLLSFAPGAPEPLSAAMGALLGAGLLLGLRTAWLRLRGVEALGLGDVKLLLLIGAFLGPVGAFASVGIASLAGLLVAAPLLAARRIARDTPLPFGAFLALGAAAVRVASPLL